MEIHLYQIVRRNSATINHQLYDQNIVDSKQRQWLLSNTTCSSKDPEIPLEFSPQKSFVYLTVEELTVTKKQSQMEGMSTTNRPHLPHYSVFGIALWMQFLVLATNVLTFTMALVKHSRKRKERLGEHSRQRILRYSVSLIIRPYDYTSIQ